MSRYWHKIFGVVCLLLAISTTTVMAQSEGATVTSSKIISSAVPFLTISPDTRAGGMGDLGAATSPDVNSQHWNPSKYAFIDGTSGVGISYIPWLRNLADDMSIMYLSGYYRLDDKQVISSSLRYFKYGSIQLADSQGQPLGVNNPNEYSFDIGYSRKLTDKWSGGVVVRYIDSRLNVVSDGLEPGKAFAADVSFYYKNSWRRHSLDRTFSMGANFSNIGSKISFDGGNTESFIPANMRLGFGYSMELDKYNKIVFNMDISKLMVPTPNQTATEASDGTISVSINTGTDQGVISSIFNSFGDAPEGFSEELKECQLSGGIEYWYANQFALRTGYFYENEDKGNRKYATLGAGVKLTSFILDFAYMIPTEQNHPLANTLRFSITFDIGSMLNAGR
ncbi:type IX secretion system outer membrane channel protein PorV [Halosquirtibacter laminarini]|uniref:Type IX secretion system outer membrane channel protein PorV n=1 Tax=Halosquirtibacter laminarini TaxID=3374600 RepID=A0AC61NPL9_9BACT|nr:type IX secretion system outer membrane channel protein PorV [Prolixibacteraceae bacterium]